MIPQELKVLHTAIAAQVLQNYIVDMKSQNWFTGVFKNFVNNFLEQFRKLETKFFDIYFEYKEEDTIALYETYDEYLKTVSKVPLWEMKNIKDLIDAYLIDPASMKWNELKAKMSMLLSPEPEIENDYIDKVVYLLRRDFDTKTQNNILLSVGKKLSELREEDMRKMESDYKFLQENHISLNSKFAY